MRVTIKLTKHNGIMQEINCESIKILDCETFLSVICDAGESSEKVFTVGKNFKPMIEVLHEN